MREFEVIKRYFANHAHRRSDVILGSGDDCALLQPPQNQILAMTIDTLVENVHFLPNTDPKSLGYKAMAVSISDLAAMGASPAWATATLSIQTIQESWCEAFAWGLFEALDEFRIALVGGDLVRGPLSITTQLTGFVPPNQALLRTGARVGDLIVVTGTLGDAGMALSLLQSSKDVPEFLLRRLNKPTPRVEVGILLRGLASSAIDISDGLLADLGHLLAYNGLGAELTLENLPLSNALAVVTGDNRALAQQLALSAGDDYELCFTIHPKQLSQLQEMSTEVLLTIIGEVTDTAQIRCSYMGQEVVLPSFGYQHF